jgi:hypothetical protein
VGRGSPEKGPISGGGARHFGPAGVRSTRERPRCALTTLIDDNPARLWTLLRLVNPACSSPLGFAAAQPSTLNSKIGGIPMLAYKGISQRAFENYAVGLRKE